MGERSKLEFGIRFPPGRAPEVLRGSVRRAEVLGFSSIWMPDTPLISPHMLDPFSDLTVAAQESSAVRLGPGVSNLSLRPLPALGAAMLSLDQISNGRAVLGLGVGASALITLGELSGHQGMFVQNPTKQRRELMRAGIDLLHRLFAGEPVQIGRRTIQLDQPRTIPIVIAASGPRGLELAGEIADGVMIQVGIDPTVLGWAIEAVRRGAERAGRDPSTLRIIASIFAVISDNRPDDIDRVRPLASYFYSVIPHVLERADVSTKKRFPDWVPEPDMTHARDWNDAMAAAKTYIPDEVVERFCLVGSPEAARRRLEELAGLGVHEAFFRWWSSYQLPDPLVEVIGTEIIPRMRG